MNRDTSRLVGSAPDMDQRPDEPGAEQRVGVQGANTVWTIISLLVAGPATWAAIGWLIDRVAGTSVFTPVGVVLGFVGSLYLVYMKYGRT